VDVAKRLDQATTCERVKLYVAMVLAAVIHARRPIPTHSLITRRIVSARQYSEFLRVMRLFADVVQRDESYVPKTFAVDKPPKTKSWKPGENILALSPPQTAISPSPAFLDCVRRAFEWYFSEHVSAIDQEARSAADLVRRHLELLGVPGSESLEEEPEPKCPDDTEPDPANVLEAFESHTHCEQVSFDRGNRMYHAMTNVKKAIRRRCTLAGEKMVEVDMHASFVANVTHLYARGDDRERLIEMLRRGNFYEQFADLAGLSPDRVKERFLRDVIFSFHRGGNPLWEAFRQHFPDTAYRLSRDRDWGDVVKIKRKQDANGRWFTCRTREGQRFLSRRLSMVESQIFWRRALMRLWNELGIPALPIHDCLLVRESDAEAARQMILECAQEVLGFLPAVKVKHG
jgi:hypothetical protein